VVNDDVVGESPCDVVVVMENGDDNGLLGTVGVEMGSIVEVGPQSWFVSMGEGVVPQRFVPDRGPYGVDGLRPRGFR
jgi:hypothetical protein